MTTRTDGEIRGERGFRPAPVSLPALCILVFACAPGGGDPGSRAGLSPFAEGALVSGRVLENNHACTVDAVCYLRLEFADTSIVAVYGSGERPPPVCDISVATSDAAFGVEAGEIVTVRVAPCGSGGLHVHELVRPDG
ncbi:MAG: hypothetical protein OEN56_10260 [Gemmatimonadota bacterium]|nr:hypothetical protein [Gemmatimonadota bacterium]